MLLLKGLKQGRYKSQMEALPAGGAPPWGNQTPWARLNLHPAGGRAASQSPRSGPFRIGPHGICLLVLLHPFTTNGEAYAVLELGSPNPRC